MVTTFFGCLLALGVSAFAEMTFPLTFAIVFLGPFLVYLSFAVLVSILMTPVTATRPWRLRRTLARIRALDEQEGFDWEFDREFRKLKRLSVCDAWIPEARRSVRSADTKSREWYLTMLAQHLWMPEALVILGEVAEDWTNPLNPVARRIVLKNRRRTGA